MSAVPPTESSLDPEIAALLRRDPAGLVAAVVQQHDTGEVLMVAWMDDEALHRTLTDRPGCQPRPGAGRRGAAAALVARRATSPPPGRMSA